MASDRTIELATLATTGPLTVEVKVSYSKGGLSFYDYKQRPGGYWLHVSPVEIEASACGNFTMKKFNFGSGRKFFVAEASRFGRKALERASEKGRDMMFVAVSMVCVEQGLTLA